jgi:tetratricopeptide (TPR) repeat protein
MMGIFQMARVLAASGKIEAGKAVLESPALKKLVAEEELDYQKGIFYFTAKDYREALVYLELVEQKRSGDFALGTVMYQAYRETGNTTSRITTIEKLLRLDEARVQKDIPWMYQELGLLCEEMNMFGRAREALETYLRYVPNAPEAELYTRKINELKAKGF